jgi:hypothetical protein
MLGLFALSAGLDLDDSSPQGKVLGWPLLLGVLGLAGFVASLLPGDRLPPALGLGRFFHGGRDDVDEDAAAPTWQQPPQQADPAPAAEEPTRQQPAGEEPTQQQQPPGEEPPRT